MRLSYQDSDSLWLCPVVWVYTLKGHGLCTAKTWTERQRVPQTDHWAASFGISGYWCKVTVAKALSHHTRFLILQWELDPMASRSGEVLRRCPGTGRYEKLACRAGADSASQNSPGTIARYTLPRRYSKWQLRSLVKLLILALGGGWTSEADKCFQGLWKPDAEHLMAESELASQ